MTPSLHVVIVTLGRPTLQRMLDSILPFLNDCDHLTMIFDGLPPQIHLNLKTKGQVHLIEENKGTCWPCHDFRNKYALKLEKTDFVMHADDDDYYTPNAFQSIRTTCIDFQTLYIFKMNIVNLKVAPTANHIVHGDIGTPNGVIPYNLNAKGTWGLRHGGDWDFYHSLEICNPTIEYVDIIIYTYLCRDFL